jgi:hypothetical protein
MHCSAVSSSTPIRPSSSHFTSNAILPRSRAFLADYGEDGQIIAKLYRPKDELAPLDLSSDNRLPEILSEREGLRRNISAYEARCDAIRAEVVEKMNGAPAAICGDWKLTHKLIHQPEQIRKATSFPRLTVTRKREATPA